MKKLAAVIGAVLGLSTMGAQAGILDLNLGNNSFRVGYGDALSNMLPGTTNGQYDVGVIAKPRKSDDFYQVHAGVLVTGDVGVPGINLAAGLGGRLMYDYDHSYNSGALALGDLVQG